MFSKTRIMYYDNSPNTAKIGDHSQYLIEIPEITKSYPYLTVGVPGTIHNWSYIPLNSYGLYCTFAEIQSLVENNDSFVPKQLNITVGHTIPLARYPSTANSTQLSFNNTIFSLIGVNEDGYVGLTQYVQDAEIQELIRTFDGVSARDGSTRATLPKRDMYFRIPYHDLPTTAVTTASTQTSMIAQTNVNQATNLPSVPVTDIHRFEYDQTLNQLIDSYIPELLQNNDNVFTLYPGENQFQKDFTNFDAKFSALDCSGPSFNETIWQLDQRLNTLINRDLTGRSADNILSLPILFTLRGNNSDYNPDNISEGTTVASVNQNFNKLTDIYFNRDGREDFTAILPKIFIKGVPIVDGDNNLVPHTFMATITWELIVECSPRSNMNSNRLQWRMTYPYLRAYQTAAGDITTAHTARSGFAMKPYRHNTFKRTPMYRYNNLTEAQRETTFTRATLKNLFRNTAGNILKSGANSPDDIAPSTFGFTMPFAAGWYEGHAFARHTNVP